MWASREPEDWAPVTYNVLYGADSPAPPLRAVMTSLSSFVITSWSPNRLFDSNALSSSGRWASLPEALSMKISSPPDA
jgi:hypothetical protein